MIVQEKIFKKYDIRGIYGQDMDEDLAYALGLAYTMLRKEDLGDKNIQLNIAVGEDMRASSPSLKKKLIEGLLDSGANVIDIGLCSTPTFYFAVGNYNYDGGIMVSASHNPAQWNGFKLVREKAKPISGDNGIMFLKEKIMNNNLEKSDAPGKLSSQENIIADQIEHDFKYVDIGKIKPLKIVLDPANSMGIQYLEAMFNRLPGEVIKINFEYDGTFPAHEADPLKPENIQQLQRRVLAEKADLGIATDGDGDRIFFVDNQGELIDPAIVRGLLAKLFLQDKPGSKIGYDVRPGKITTDLILENGGLPRLTRVGHSLIKEAMLQEDMYFAGESSGHFFLNMPIGCFESPIIVTLKLLQDFSQQNTDIAQYIKQFKKYFHSGEINREVENKEAVFQRIKEHYNDAEITELDGISVSYNDYWFNVRGSNTEEKIRLNLEAVNQDIMQKKTKEVLSLIY